MRFDNPSWSLWSYCRLGKFELSFWVEHEKKGWMALFLILVYFFLAVFIAYSPI